MLDNTKIRTVTPPQNQRKHILDHRTERETQIAQWSLYKDQKSNQRVGVFQTGGVVLKRRMG